MRFVVFALTASEPSYAEAACRRLTELGYAPKIVGTQEWLRVAVGSPTCDPVEADERVIELKSQNFREAFALAEANAESEAESE